MSAELVVRNAEIVPADEARSRFMPVLRIEDAIQRRGMIVEFMRRAMIEGQDYGKIPGTDKPALLKPGAEKTSVLFGLSPEFSTIESVEDWDGAAHGDEPFFYYRLKCRLKRGDIVIGEGEGSCNSRESKYRYRWVREDEIPDGLDRAKLRKRGGVVHEFTFSVDKAETSGKYGKPLAYWQAWRDAIATPGKVWKAKITTKAGKEYDAWHMNSVEYQVPNPDIADQVNTILKMAAKRAHVAAALNLGLSDLFTQDEEMLGYTEQPSATEDGPPTPPPPTDEEPPAGPAAAPTQASPRAPGPRSVPKPTAAPAPNGEADPPELAKILATFTAWKPIMDAFAQMHRAYDELLGADQEYYAVLAKHGCQHANEFGEIRKGRAMFRDLWNRIKELQAKIQGA